MDESEPARIRGCGLSSAIPGGFFQCRPMERVNRLSS